MRRKKNIVIFIIMEVLLLSLLLGIFLLPLTKRNQEFTLFYNDNESQLVNKILKSVNNSSVHTLEDNFIPIENLAKGLIQLDNYFIENKIVNYKIVDCRFKTSIKNDIKERNVTFQYSIELDKDRFGVLNIELYTRNNDLKIKMIRFLPLKESIEVTNSFYGKLNLTRILILIFSVCLILLVAYSEYDYFKKAKKMKIWVQLLLPLSLIGVNIDWNSLIMTLNIASISMFPVSTFSSGNTGVWEFGIKIPVMIIIYWTIIRKKHFTLPIEKKDNI